MQVSFDMRVASGSDFPVGETGSGFGAVNARAMLQLLAPRSRTWGNVRFISCSFLLGN